jgi:hypothetical protein
MEIQFFKNMDAQSGSCPLGIRSMSGSDIAITHPIVQARPNFNANKTEVEGLGFVIPQPPA